MPFRFNRLTLKEANELRKGVILKISIIMPVFNEMATLKEIIRRVEDLDLDKEIILVDDCSTDNSWEILQEYKEKPGFKIFKHDINRGKGAALRTAFKEASGDIVAIQDADLEYDPKDILKLIQPILDGFADVVYGSRFLGGGGPVRVHLFWHMIGNRVITMLSNMCTNLNLTDVETCYKAFKKEHLDKLNLSAERFAIELELTQKLSKNRARFYEIPISYHGRNYDEGKKITWRDGFSALFHIVKYRFTS